MGWDLIPSKAEKRRKRDEYHVLFSASWYFQKWERSPSHMLPPLWTLPHLPYHNGLSAQTMSQCKSLFKLLLLDIWTQQQEKWVVLIFRALLSVPLPPLVCPICHELATLLTDEWLWYRCESNCYCVGKERKLRSCQWEAWGLWNKANG